MGNKVAHFLVFGRLMRPITEPFTPCDAVQRYVLPDFPQPSWRSSPCCLFKQYGVCTQTDEGFFFSVLIKIKNKSLCGYYCAVQIISLLFALRCLPGAARLITICYDPRNCKRVHKTPVLISAQPEITKLKQVFHKHRMWIFNST